MVVHPFEKLSNFRDVGGVRTAQGRLVKRGVLYRSEALTQLSTRDQRTLRSLNIKLVCDLRAPRESERAPPKLGRKSAIRVVSLAMDDDRTQEQFRGELREVLLGRADEAPISSAQPRVYRHLATDRTANTRAVMSSWRSARASLRSSTAPQERTARAL